MALTHYKPGWKTNDNDPYSVSNALDLTKQSHIHNFIQFSRQMRGDAGKRAHASRMRVEPHAYLSDHLLSSSKRGLTVDNVIFLNECNVSTRDCSLNFNKQLQSMKIEVAKLDWILMDDTIRTGCTG